MSLAPASSLGAFLKARFAVKGIQWAARPFGTLTAAGRGLLSSMGGPLAFWGAAAIAQAISFVAIRERHRAYFSARSSGVRRRRAASEIGSADPEHFDVGLLGIPPYQRERRQCAAR